jgi:haloalkane dehalogenase
MNCTAKLVVVMALSSTVAGAFGQSIAAPEGMKEQTNLRNTRYCEIFIVTRHLSSATAAVYNTLGLNDCPAKKWDSLDTNRLKKQFGAARVILNGPRYFTMDQNALRNPGKVESFDGLEARLVAQLEVHKGKRVPYTENTVGRESQYVFDSGKNVYELLSRNGHIYIMQSYSQEVDKNLNEQGLLSLSSRLKLPKGWQYRVRKLDQDLVVRNAGGNAYVLQDELKNTYQRMP